MDRIILHSDLNNFYASAEAVKNPALRGIPLAVAGDKEARHGIVLAKNYEAKRFGVATGEPLWQAKQKCPDITFVPPSFELYSEFSAKVRKIYNSYTDKVEPFGLDECWLDVTGSRKLFCPEARDEYDAGLIIAHKIRRQVKEETGLTVSVGVSFNKTFAKLASDMRKPDAVTGISRENYKRVAWALPVSDLLFVGKKTERKLQMYGIDTIGKLAQADERLLKLLLGKNGLSLRAAAAGLDTLPVLSVGEMPRVKSIGNGTTMPRDIHTDEEAKIVLYRLCESVSSRMREQNLLCRTVVLGIKQADLFSFERQMPLKSPTRTAEELFRAAFELLRRNRCFGGIRSLSVRATGLSEDTSPQIAMFPEAESLGEREILETCIDRLRGKFGDGALKRGIMLADPSLCSSDFGLEREVVYS